MTTTPELTDKQAKVLDLLEKGLSATAIAKRWKVTDQAIHGHIRNIRKKGFTIPAERYGETNGASEPAEPENVETLEGEPEDEAQPEPEPAASANGHVDPTVALHQAIEAGETRSHEIEMEISQLNDRLTELRAEADAIATQADKYTRALEQLA